MDENTTRDFSFDWIKSTGRTVLVVFAKRIYVLSLKTCLFPILKMKPSPTLPLSLAQVVCRLCLHSSTSPFEIAQTRLTVTGDYKSRIHVRILPDISVTSRTRQCESSSRVRTKLQDDSARTLKFIKTCSPGNKSRT